MARRAAGRHSETRDGFFKRGAGPFWWTTLHDGRRVSTRCRDIEAARAWRTDQERRAVDPGYSAARTLTLRTAMVDFVKHLQVRGRSEGTIDFYSRKLGHVLGHLGERLPVSAVTPLRVQQYVDDRLGEPGVGPATVRKEVHALASMARWLWRTERWPYDPSKLVPDRLGGEYRPRSRFLTRDELDAVLAELAPHHAAWVCAAVATGGRLGEVNRLRTADVNLDAGTVAIRVTKTKATEGDVRTIPVLDVSRPLLERALRDGCGRDGLVLRPWASSNIARTLKAACEAAAVPRCSPNDFRRTLASWLRQDGVPTGLVAWMLGHTSSTMVERVYGKLRPEDVLRLVRAACTAGVRAGKEVG